MNQIIAQTPVPPIVKPPTMYLDFPPELLTTLAYIMFTVIFHWVCYSITKLIYGH